MWTSNHRFPGSTHSKTSPGLKTSAIGAIGHILHERFNNYLFLEANGQLCFIKPANYERQKSSFKKQIGRILSVRVDGSGILDFLRYAAAFFLAKQQYYEWRRE